METLSWLCLLLPLAGVATLQTIALGEPLPQLVWDAGWLLIIGAGPTGLYSAYYAGFRGMSVAVVDSLPELGGQITAMYPEKQILDVAGFPTVKGRDLVEGLVAQAATAKPTYHLDRTASTLRDEGDRVVVGHVGPVRRTRTRTQEDQP